MHILEFFNNFHENTKINEFKIKFLLKKPTVLVKNNAKETK